MKPYFQILHRFLLTMAVCCFFGVVVLGQTVTGTLQGTVTDANGCIKTANYKRAAFTGCSFFMGVSPAYIWSLVPRPVHLCGAGLLRGTLRSRAALHCAPAPASPPSISLTLAYACNQVLL